MFNCLWCLTNLAAGPEEIVNKILEGDALNVLVEILQELDDQNIQD